jgi:hypothetical protein
MKSICLVNFHIKRDNHIHWDGCYVLNEILLENKNIEKIHLGCKIIQLIKAMGYHRRD